MIGSPSLHPLARKCSSTSSSDPGEDDVSRLRLGLGSCDRDAALGSLQRVRDLVKDDVADFLPERLLGVGLDRTGVNREARLVVAEDRRDRPGHRFEPAGHDTDRRDVRLLGYGNRSHYPGRAAAARANSHHGRVHLQPGELLLERVEDGVVVAEVADEMRVINELDVRYLCAESLLERTQDLVTFEQMVPDQRDSGAGQRREAGLSASAALGRPAER